MSSRPRIEFLADAEHPGGVLLVMDAVLQSYVDTEDPTYLDFEYVQYFASIVSTLPAGPLAVTHVGGGALTMPRYLNAVRPGSRHIVLEPDVELTELVRQRLPLGRGHGIRVRPQAGVEGVAALADSSADLLIVDAFADGRVPKELTTLEFFTDCSRVVRAEGMLLLNLVDEPGLRYVARVAAGLLATFAEVVLVGASDVVKGRRFGNVVLAATSRPLEVVQLRRSLARQPFPATALDTVELSRRIGGAKPWAGEDGAESPEPSRSGWRIS